MCAFATQFIPRRCVTTSLISLGVTDNRLRRYGLCLQRVTLLSSSDVVLSRKTSFYLQLSETRSAYSIVKFQQQVEIILNKRVAKYYYLFDNRNTFSMILVTRGLVSVSQCLGEVILISVSNSQLNVQKTLPVNALDLLLSSLLLGLTLVRSLNEATCRQ